MHDGVVRVYFFIRALKALAYARFKFLRAKLIRACKSDVPFQRDCVRVGVLVVFERMTDLKRRFYIHPRDLRIPPRADHRASVPLAKGLFELGQIRDVS